MDRLAHWSLVLWVAPAAALALWTFFIVEPLKMSASVMNPIWIMVLGASVILPLVAGVYWLTHLQDLRAILALLVNMAGIAVNVLGLILAAGHAAG